ncbi:TonB-dependent receptor [Hyphobacterium marinum]|uniref:TonB-dependent receptor n=1 Tax=Hyphobacterium marinum TaxID=3116574 RepID=A0ABU7LUQ9_9PROT|nr:TonB-dependent receptor [Hyphobacterium sp. Y6023]MEE2565269.1 TonB-dependent receptor [Hyphobacterium sp. Y6023]
MTRVFKTSLLSGAAALAFTAPLDAQTAPQPEERDRIVVTGSAIETASGETLQSVDVLDIDDIADSFDGSLGASLADLPGISTTSFGPAVGRPIIRGLGGDRIRILNNGVGLVDASAISVDHAGTSEVLDAEQIDILRGPAAIAYGGGAIGGVINVIDGRIPSRPIDGPVEGQVYAGYTSVDDGFQFAGRARVGTGPISFQFEASHREADDLSIPGFAESARLRALEDDDHHHEDDNDDHDHDDEEEAYGSVPNSGFTFQTVGGGAALNGPWGYFGISVRSYEADYGLPGHEHHHDDDDHDDSAPLFAFDDDDEDHDEEGDARIDMEQTRWDARGEFNLAVGPFDHLDVSVGVADYSHAELEPDGAIGTLFETEGWEMRAALVNERGEGPWNGSVGVQALRTDFSATGEEAFVPPVESRDFGVFAAQRLDLDTHGFDFGLRFEHREHDALANPDRDFDTVSAAAGVFLRPADNRFVGFSLARTERAPTAAELYSDGPHAATETVEVGDADLGVETGWAFDFTYRATGAAWLVEAGLFYSMFDGFIYLAPTGMEDPVEELPIFQYLQDDATLWGGEIYVERDITEIGPWALVGDLTVEYVRGETDSFGNLPRLPPLSATVGAELQRDIVDLRGEVVWAADQDRTAAFELPTDGYTLVNFSATAHPFGDNTRLMAEVRNVTDEEARLHTSQLKDMIPLAGRSFRLAVLHSF